MSTGLRAVGIYIGFGLVVIGVSIGVGLVMAAKAKYRK